MKMFARVVGISVASLLAIACSSQVTNGSINQETSADKEPVLAGSQSVATLVSGASRIAFFAVAGGPPGVVEVAPAGGKLVLSDPALRGLSYAELYKALGGSESTLPEALRGGAALQAARAVDPEQKTTAPKASKASYGSERPTGIQPDTAADQSAFAAAYCGPGFECVQGYEYANSSYGSEARGYVAYAENGSEAIHDRLFEVDWWTGSAWSQLFAIGLGPGEVGYFFGGNTGQPQPRDILYYFKSELVNNAYDDATVSLSDELYTFVSVCGVPGEPAGTTCSCGYEQGECVQECGCLPSVCGCDYGTVCVSTRTLC